MCSIERLPNGEDQVHAQQCHNRESYKFHISTAGTGIPGVVADELGKDVTGLERSACARAAVGAALATSTAITAISGLIVDTSSRSINGARNLAYIYVSWRCSLSISDYQQARAASYRRGKPRAAQASCIAKKTKISISLSHFSG